MSEASFPLDLSEASFPLNLLEKSKEERFTYFEEFIISHPILDNVIAEVMQLINLSKKGRVIMVFGPTGVGKTTLIQSLNNRIIQKYLNELQNDSNFIPLVSVEAPMPIVGNFNWNDLFNDMLEQLNEPIQNSPFFRQIEKCVDQERKDFFEKFGYNRYSRLRFVVEKALRTRRSKIVNIDEAQHIAVLASARKLLDQPNTIKSVANRTKTVQILFGNYDLLLFRKLNGQLSRRIDSIHFSRYDCRKTDDVKKFQNIIWIFQNHLPVEKTPNLVKIWEYLYERSIGCVGILKEWLDRAYKLMLEKDSKEFTLKHLEETALSESACITIANEIIAAEEKLSGVFEGESSLKSILNKALETEDGLPSKDSKKKNSKKNTRVGVRKPHRDQVGEVKNEN